MKIISLDAETNGLYGDAFAISAVLYHNNDKISTFSVRCPIEGEVDHWVANNVLPKMKDIPETHSSYEEMLKAFINWWLENKSGATVIGHMVCPVEAKLFIDAHKMGYLGTFEGPYVFTDIAAYPQINDSVDSYIAKNQLVPCPKDLECGTHNPLFDAYSALSAYLYCQHGIEVKF